MGEKITKKDEAVPAKNRNVRLMGVKVLPVVMIETANGPVAINKSDFDEKTMKLSDAKVPEAPKSNPPANKTGGESGSGDASKFNYPGVTIPVLRVVAKDLDLSLEGATNKTEILAVYDSLEGDKKEAALAAVKAEVED